MPVISLDLFMDQYADFTVTPIWTSGGSAVSYVGATATLMIRLNATDVSPLVSISTTPNSQGSIVFGPAGTIPAGGIQINITNAATATLPTVAPLPAYDLIIAWGGGTKQTFCSGYVHAAAGYDH